MAILNKEIHLIIINRLFLEIKIKCADVNSIFFVYLGAACLPLNVVENQTRARSSVPTKIGEGCAAFAALGGLTQKKGYPPFPLRHYWLSLLPGGRGQRRPATRTPAFFSPSRAPSLKSDLPSIL